MIYDVCCRFDTVRWGWSLRGRLRKPENDHGYRRIFQNAHGTCTNFLQRTRPPTILLNDNDLDISLYTMAPVSLLDLVSALPSNDGWGPAPSTETTLDGVPYAPYSKADKLGRMADWTEGKDRERGGRQQYGGRNYRGVTFWIPAYGSY